jgi:apolipoprotein D and lipocalin family protein
MKTLILVLFLCTAQFSFAGSKPPLATVNFVSVDKYLGTWYEIAAFPQKFQKGCTATKAEYSLRHDGDIKVLNSCNLGSPDGELKLAEGRAWVKNKKTNAKLKVQFFLRNFRFFLFSGNYWILDLDKNYESVLVGDKSRKYLWILSRDPKMNPERYSELVAKAQKLQFDTSKLVKTIH